METVQELSLQTGKGPEPQGQLPEWRRPLSGRKDKVASEFGSRNWCWDAVLVGTEILAMEDVDPKSRGQQQARPLENIPAW